MKRVRSFLTALAMVLAFGLVFVSCGDDDGNVSGGVYIYDGIFTNSGGTISGNDVPFRERNTAAGQGHALYWNSYPYRWRNFTAGPDDNSGDSGFWVNY